MKRRGRPRGQHTTKAYAFRLSSRESDAFYTETLDRWIAERCAAEDVGVSVALAGIVKGLMDAYTGHKPPAVVSSAGADIDALLADHQARIDEQLEQMRQEFYDMLNDLVNDAPRMEALSRESRDAAERGEEVDRAVIDNILADFRR